MSRVCELAFVNYHFIIFGKQNRWQYTHTNINRSICTPYTYVPTYIQKCTCNLIPDHNDTYIHTYTDLLVILSAQMQVAEHK